MSTFLPAAIPEHVISEGFDGEFLVANLKSGSYFSLQGIAGKVWELVRQGQNSDQVLAQAGVELSANGLDLFGDFLLAEGLIVGEPPASAAELPSRINSSVFAGLLEKHSDMEKLLMIDPIHEVDAAGWPKAT